MSETQDFQGRLEGGKRLPHFHGLRQVLSLASREFGFYFNSPIAYLVIVLFLVVTGAMLFVFDVPGQGLDFFKLNEANLRALFGPTEPKHWGGLPLLFAFLIPAITMRLLAEEKRSGTIELLVTWPVTDGRIILGKFLGSLYFVFLMLLATLPLLGLLAYLGSPDWGLVLGGYLGLFLLAAAYAAIGLFASSLTENQIVAFLLGTLLSAFFYFIDGMVSLFGDGLRDAFASLSFKAHFQNIARGVVDLRDIVFYLSVIAVFLLLSTLSLGARRWKE